MKEWFKRIVGTDFLLLNAISIAGTVIGMGLAYLYQILCARSLSLQEYGTLGVLIGIWTNMTTPLGSLTAVLMRELNKRVDQPAQANYVMQKYLRILGIGSAALAILAAILAWAAGQPLLALIFISFPSMVLIAIVNAWLQARERILELTIVQNGGLALRMAALVVLLGLGWGLLGAVAAIPIYSGIIAITLVAWMAPKIQGAGKTDTHLRMAFLAIAALQLLQTFMIYEDLFIIKIVQGGDQTGIYNAAENTAKILFLLASAISLVLYPKIAKMNGAQLRTSGLRLLAISLALLIPVFIGFQLLAQPFILLFYGDKFAASVSPFLVLAIAMLLAGWAQILSTFLLARHAERGVLAIYGGGVVLNAIVLLLVVPTRGLVAAAWASTAGSLLVAIALALLMLRQLGREQATA